MFPEEYALDTIEVFRGLGNFHYYKTKKNRTPDFLSKFTSIEDGFPYFEKNLLNSFSLSERVAERFMLCRNGRRRVKIESTFEDICHNLFSSFIVSDSFIQDQYEILTLPNKNDMFIFQETNDKLMAEFYISTSNEKTERLIRIPKI